MENQAESTFNPEPLIDNVNCWGPEKVAEALHKMIFDFANLVANTKDLQLSIEQADNIMTLQLLRDAIREGVKPAPGKAN